MTFLNSKVGPKTIYLAIKHLKHGAYMYYKICPKMSVESWKSYLVRPCTVFTWTFFIFFSGKRPPPIEGCPESLEALMTRCWNKDAQIRPTMGEIVQKMQFTQQFFPTGDDPIFPEESSNFNGNFFTFILISRNFNLHLFWFHEILIYIYFDFTKF